MTLFELFQILHDVKDIYITNRNGNFITSFNKDDTNNLDKYINSKVLYIEPLDGESVEISIDRIR